MLRSGVIGLGKIGMPMARRVLGKGFPLAVRDVRAEAMESLAAGGARACASPAEVARHSDVICVVVLDDAQVEEVLLGPQGVVEGAESELVVCVSRTVRESTVFRLANELRPRGIDVSDAGVAGGYQAAEVGTLVALGLMTSWAAFICSGMMAVAYFTIHLPNGFWPILNHGEMSALYCWAFLFIAAHGSGKLSLDKAFNRT